MFVLGIKRALTLAALIVAGTLGIVTGTASASTGNTLHVATTGSDVGNCVSSPCATINYALGQAASGATIKVAAGSYHQTVAITKPIHLIGSGSRRTTLNGAGLDPGGTFYGVVYVGTTGGAVFVKGFTITNPFPFAYTGGEPQIIALADQGAGDSVSITRNVLSEGTADSTRGTDFPIGIDTFKNVATTTFSHNTVTGTFQGGLFEDNGPLTFSDNKIENLISNTSAPTTYSGEGVFLLSDLSGAITGQKVTHNRFSGYAGLGAIMEAGYDNGNCSTTPCNGSIAGSISHNTFFLGGASDGVAIDLQASFAGNALTATVTHNRGSVTSPTQAIVVQPSSGATTSVSQSHNDIHVRP